MPAYQRTHHRSHRGADECVSESTAAFATTLAAALRPSHRVRQGRVRSRPGERRQQPWRLPRPQPLCGNFVRRRSRRWSGTPDRRLPVWVWLRLLGPRTRAAGDATAAPLREGRLLVRRLAPDGARPSLGPHPDQRDRVHAVELDAQRARGQTPGRGFCCRQHGHTIQVPVRGLERHGRDTCCCGLRVRLLPLRHRHGSGWEPRGVCRGMRQPQLFSPRWRQERYP
mmetsp:Transcript_38728/g.128208  ORF Transcript_38728/g.128208 Transcript_38728/m.128208 type:complete len:226 (+) Transcript_38728:463-1140(+)